MKKLLLFSGLVIATGCNADQAPLAIPSATPTGSEIVETIVRNEVSGGRYVFIYLPANVFTQESLLSVVKQYESDCDPYELTLEIYSDRDLLQKAIRRERVPMATDFANTDEGRIEGKQYVEETYWPSGSMIARYNRSHYSEEGVSVRFATSGPRDSINLRKVGFNSTCPK